MTISEPAATTDYPVGHDTQLDLKGLQLEFTLDNGQKYYIRPAGDKSVRILCDIDFSKPGKYTVTLERGFTCSFDIAVS